MTRTQRMNAAEIPEAPPADEASDWQWSVVEGGEKPETLEQEDDDQVAYVRDETDDGPLVGVVHRVEKDGEEGESRRKGRDNSTYTGSADLVRVYLNQIGKTPLLNAEQEVELAKRIEAGVFAGAVLRIVQARRQGTEAVSRLKADLTKLDMKVASEKAGIKDEDEQHQHAKNFIAFLDRQADMAPVGSQRFKDLQQVESTGLAAVNHLQEANLRLVVSVAKRYTGHGVDFLDLIQMGNQGLNRAMMKFDFRKGYKFSTYATWWIRQSITRAMADEGATIRLPVYVYEKHRKMDGAVRELLKDGREITPENVAEQMDEDIKDVLKYMRDARVAVSLDMEVDSDRSSRVHDGGTSLHELMADPKDPTGSAAENAVAAGEVSTRLDAALRSLDKREALVMRLRFGIGYDGPHTLDQIGAVFGVTRERARQIELMALQKLRDPSRIKQLEGLLDTE